MAIGKTVLIVGVIILIVGIALFFIGGYLTSSGLIKVINSISTATPTTLQPGTSQDLGVPTKLSILLYNTSSGQVLKILQEINGTNQSVPQIAEKGYIIALLSPKYDTIMVNNLTTPISVKYVLSQELASSLVNVALYTGLGFFLAIIGVIVLLVGLVLFLRGRGKKQ
ncbi:hypothetical protein [Saccharolobus islandicus]|uniref:Uncharacterized protein n=1 Tax=Saccharolobus islandicus (strain M.16.4 / Kamchatka \|nr:hypothetical protein [Sulfolobus islandicus]ACR41135.1 conserved hypothetical protein [Sulfolobus islandicus M.16.4]